MSTAKHYMAHKDYLFFSKYAVDSFALESIHSTEKWLHCTIFIMAVDLKWQANKELEPYLSQKEGSMYKVELQFQATV